MEYNLSDTNENKKQRYEEKIEQNNEKYLKLTEEISNIRTSKEGTAQERQLAILELQIQQEEIERDTVTKEQAIASIYVKEMKENLIQRRKNKEISKQEFENENENIYEYKRMIKNKNNIEDYDYEESILQLKLKLEHMKKSMGKVPEEQADNNIAEIKQKLSDNKEYRQNEEDDLAKQNFKYKRRNLYYKKNSGEITTDELKQKLEELKQTEGKIPTKEEFEKMLNDLTEKHLEQPQQSQDYEREVSARDNFYTSQTWEQKRQQDIDKTHENNVYHSTIDFDNKIQSYGVGVNAQTNEDYLSRIGYKIGQEYARGKKGEKSKLAKEFAMLEVKGRCGEFKNPYDRGTITNGNDNPKYLLQLEEIKGLDVDNVVGLDTSTLKQKTFVATYEIEVKENVYKPIKEYYQIDEYGEMVIIGTGIDGKVSLVVDGLEMDFEPDEIIQGETIEKVTQMECADRLIKNGIEDSMKNGNVTEVSQITDWEFLNDFAKQCGLEEGDLDGRTFIISTVNEKGEEEFDIIVRNDPETTYEHLEGIYATEKQGREIYTQKEQTIPGVGTTLDKTKTLKEFMTKSGNRYSITRGQDGKLGFNEIFRENENIIQGMSVDSYTFSTNDLLQTWQRAGMTQVEVESAYKTIENTVNKPKDEKGQTQDSGVPLQGSSEGR